MPIDYERANREAPKLKAALTRASNKPLPERYDAVLACCKVAIKAWAEWGAWPDNWAHWNRALGDAATKQAYETGRMPAIIHLDQL